MSALRPEADSICSSLVLQVVTPLAEVAPVTAVRVDGRTEPNLKLAPSAGEAVGESRGIGIFWNQRRAGSCLRYTDRDAFYLGGAALIVTCGKGPDSMP